MWLYYSGSILCQFTSPVWIIQVNQCNVSFIVLTKTKTHSETGQTRLKRIYTVYIFYTVVGLLSKFSPLSYFARFSGWSKYRSPTKHHIYIYQLSPQLSCGDTWQIWRWFKGYYVYFYKVKIYQTENYTKRSFSNPKPSWLLIISHPRYHLLIRPWTMKYTHRQKTCRRSVIVVVMNDNNCVYDW